MIKLLMVKVDSIQECMGKVGRRLEILEKNQKKMIEIQNYYNGNEGCLEGLINKLDTAEKTISELEDRSHKLSKKKCNGKKE